MTDRTGPTRNLVLFAGVLAIALAGGLAIGAWTGSDDPADADATDAAGMTGEDVAHDPAGLAISTDGYTLALDQSTVPAGVPADLSLRILGPDGDLVTDVDISHERPLHLIVAGRDLTGYAHVHPELDADGTWSVTAPALAPGSYRVYADFVPTGEDGLTLAADLLVPGEVGAPPARDVAASAVVGDYEVTLDGELTAGSSSAVTLTVQRNGEPVTDLDPYLGALGHLVAIRDGDMAYLHVHPLEDADGPGGPSVRFAVEVPSATRYGLFFDFSHDGEVNTASFVVDAGGTASATHTESPVGTEGEHGH